MKKILFILMAMVLCAGSVGAAFAYFTDVEKSTGNAMTAGTLDIQIADNNQGWRDTEVTASYVSPSDWAPGDIITTDPVRLKNVGTIDIERIYARFCNFAESEGTNTDAEDAAAVATDIGNYIRLIAYAESNDGGATWYYESFEDDFVPGDGTASGGDSNANAYLNYWIGRGAPLSADGAISLRDLVVASAYGSGDKVTALCMFDGGNVPSDPPLVPNAVAAFKFVFELLPETSNAYQGDIASFNVNFIASMVDTYPDDLLNDSITEPLDPRFAP